MKRTTPSKRRKQPTRKRPGARSARTPQRAARDAGPVPSDSPPPGWSEDDDSNLAAEPEPEVISDALWDWEQEELDYAQDIEIEQYALRVLRFERDD